jgi:hypothetical protein
MRHGARLYCARLLSRDRASATPWLPDIDYLLRGPHLAAAVRHDARVAREEPRQSVEITCLSCRHEGRALQEPPSVNELAVRRPHILRPGVDSSGRCSTC